MSEHTVKLRQQQDYQFEIDFGVGSTLRSDLPPPNGHGSGPTPEHLLAAAVGNCLAASLLFALRKFKQRPDPVGCEASAEVGRNAEGRLRVLAMHVTLTLGVPGEQIEHLQRVLDTFEAYCTVTQSVRQGVPVVLRVLDSSGAVLKG